MFLSIILQLTLALTPQVHWLNSCTLLLSSFHLLGSLQANETIIQTKHNQQLFIVNKMQLQTSDNAIVTSFKQ